MSATEPTLLDVKTFDTIGDRQKLYEQLPDGRLLPGVPVLLRLDGRTFHTFTKGLGTPFDVRFDQIADWIEENL